MGAVQGRTLAAVIAGRNPVSVSSSRLARIGHDVVGMGHPTTVSNGLAALATHVKDVENCRWRTGVQFSYRCAWR